LPILPFNAVQDPVQVFIPYHTSKLGSVRDYEEFPLSLIRPEDLIQEWIILWSLQCKNDRIHFGVLRETHERTVQQPKDTMDVLGVVQQESYSQFIPCAAPLKQRLVGPESWFRDDDTQFLGHDP
jgi:hypothetical protein